MIPLYAVGVFLSFTLSQTGMVRHHLTRARTALETRRGHQRAPAPSRPRSSTIIVASTKFTSGAWIPLVVIPMIVLLFKTIKKHYRTVADGLRVPNDYQPRRMNHTVVVLVGSVHRGVLEALAYAKSLAPEPSRRGHRRRPTRKRRNGSRSSGRTAGIDIPLEIVHSPYRELTRPVLRFIDELDARYENDIMTVVIPEFVVTSWWAHLLHNQSALFLEGPVAVPQGHGRDLGAVPRRVRRTSEEDVPPVDDVPVEASLLQSPEPTSEPQNWA